MRSNGIALVVGGVVLLVMGLVNRAVPDRVGPGLTGVARRLHRFGRWGWTVGIPAVGLFFIVQGVRMAVGA